MRQLVVNADDFGASSATNLGIIQAHAQGIVTSTSLMVRGPAALEAAAYAKAHPQLGFGLHVDLGEWVYQDSQWVERYNVVDLNDTAAVTAEVERQHAHFCEILGRGPTHIDSHQHVHRQGPAHQSVLALGERLNVPVRHCHSAIQYCGNFYGQTGKGYPYHQAITVAALIETLRGLGSAAFELACHPGLDEQLPSTYRIERINEVRSLCDPDIRQCINEQSIELLNFSRFRF